VKPQEKARAAELLRAAPELSNNTIAAETGLEASTIRRLRRAMGDEFDLDHRVALNGKPWSREGARRGKRAAMRCGTGR
jgi:hypothetical protein